MLQHREQEVFHALAELRGQAFVLIGGYAVNAYTLPRFSVDCDLVVRDRAQASAIRRQLGIAYRETASGGFLRLERSLSPDVSVSIDILIGEVHDRLSGARFTAEWLFGRSAPRVLHGKTFPRRLRLRIADPEALVAMKWASMRSADARDVFMLAPLVDSEWVRREVGTRIELAKWSALLWKNVSARQFRDNLQGVFGAVDERLFRKHLEAVRHLCEG